MKPSITTSISTSTSVLIKPSTHSDHQPIVLTDDDNCFHRRLSLWNDGGTSAAAAWFDCAFNEPATICLRRLPTDNANSISTINSEITRIACHPYDPWVVRFASADELFWIGMRNQHGCLMRASSDGTTQPVAIAESWNCGDLAVASTEDGTTWLAVQVWESEQVSIRLLRCDDTQWDVVELPHTGTGGSCNAVSQPFAARPALSVSPDGHVMVAWDEYNAGAYRCMTAFVSDHAVTSCNHIALPDHDACRPTAIHDAEGTPYLAYCLERRIDLHGAIGRHSEIVCAAWHDTTQQWQETTRANIDHAMNPWLAGYAGHRRQPWLTRSDNGGIWLAFEEKIDTTSMSPGNGRLIVRDMHGTQDHVLHNDKSGYVLAPHLMSDGRLLFAFKNQDERWTSGPTPYEITYTRPDQSLALRPTPLLYHRDAPTFQAQTQTRNERPTWLSHQLFFGDPHNHSTLSGDLEGDPDEMYHQVRDTAGLDFVAFTENDYVGFTYPLPDSAYQVSRRFAEFFNRDDVFTSFVGWEYTLQKPEPGSEVDEPLSHRNVLTDGNNIPIHSCYDGNTPSSAMLVKKLRGQRVLLHHHHETGFDITDETVERNIEIASGWHAHMSESKKFRANLHALLDTGMRLGFIGGSDSHDRNAGFGGALTGVWATHNTRHEIFNALCERRCFATTGPRPDLRLTVAGAPMGSSVVGNESPEVDVYAACDQLIQRLEIIRNGHVIAVSMHNDYELTHRFVDHDCPAGDHYYYVHVTFEGTQHHLPFNQNPAYGNHAWTTPVWVKRNES